MVDLSQTRGKMALFDTVISAEPRDYVVDVPHHQFDRFLAVIEEIDVIRAAEEIGLATTVLFLCDPSSASIAYARYIKSQIRNAHFIIVRNEAVRAVNLDLEVANAYREICGAGFIVLPQMNGSTVENMANNAYSFGAFLNGETPAISPEKHRAAYDSFCAIFMQFERMQLRLEIDYLRNTGVV